MTTGLTVGLSPGRNVPPRGPLNLPPGDNVRVEFHDGVNDLVQQVKFAFCLFESEVSKSVRAQLCSIHGKDPGSDGI